MYLHTISAGPVPSSRGTLYLLLIFWVMGRYMVIYAEVVGLVQVGEERQAGRRGWNEGSGVTRRAGGLGRDRRRS